jgi:hypothetical protein
MKISLIAAFALLVAGSSVAQAQYNDRGQQQYGQSQTEQRNGSQLDQNNRMQNRDSSQMGWNDRAGRRDFNNRSGYGANDTYQRRDGYSGRMADYPRRRQSCYWRYGHRRCTWSYR